jgi:hypothetical protein
VQNARRAALRLLTEQLCFGPPGQAANACLFQNRQLALTRCNFVGQ